MVKALSDWARHTQDMASSAGCQKFGQSCPFMGKMPRLAEIGLGKASDDDVVEKEKVDDEDDEDEIDLDDNEVYDDNKVNDDNEVNDENEVNDANDANDAHDANEDNDDNDDNDDNEIQKKPCACLII